MEECVGKQVSHQQHHLPLQTGNDECESCFSLVCFCLTKCPSAALQAELWCLAVGWDWRGLMTLIWLLIVFFAVFSKWTIQRGAVSEDLRLKKTAFFGTQSKKGDRLYWLNALISLCWCRYLDLLFCFFSSWLSICCVRNVVELSSKCCIIGNWTCFSLWRPFTSHPSGFFSLLTELKLRAHTCP